MTNSTEALDLYAKIEGMLENETAISDLYGSYLKVLDEISFTSLLDVGCGSGGFLELVRHVFAPKQLKGIDLSPIMVARTKSRGIDAQVIDLCKVEEQYEVITAVFDMVNYLDKSALNHFMRCIYDRLAPGGYFVCDINSEYGFSEIASGSFTAEDQDQFLVIDSEYDAGKYHSHFTLFERKGTLYDRSDEQIMQYYHTAEQIAEAGGLVLVSDTPIALYSEASDKHFLLLQKI